LRYFEKKPGAKALYLDSSILKLLTYVIGPMSQE
jgi:vacuolar protein sorting-associated protein 33A